MQHRLQEAEAMSLDEYQKLLDERARCRAIYAKLSSVCDVCITLSAPGPALVGIATGDPTFAIPASLLGVPTVSLPLLEVDGLPLGLQVMGFNGADVELFAAAAFLRDA
jgi:Asp-tRNA(Asn)/Glu-tRNA(Gln) amidotransferase A subunit family amidase